MNDRIREDPLEDKSPLFHSWNHWYALVLIFLTALIVFFYTFTKAYE